MPNPLLTLIARGGVNPGIVAGGAVDDSEDHRKPTTKIGAIVGIALSVTLLLILIVGAFLYDRRKKKRAARGTKTAEVGGTYEEISPLATGGHPMPEGGQGYGQPPLGPLPGPIYHPPPYQGAQYPLEPQGQNLGQQGTDFYRNQ